MKVLANPSTMSRTDAPGCGGVPHRRVIIGTMAVRISSSNIDSLSLKCRYIVPLATPARLATSSSRVAANPRAMNSSIAASIIAPRRSAARSARLEAGLGDAGAADVVSPARRLAGFGADFLGVLLVVFVMHK